jgi:hypothetical protein
MTSFGIGSGVYRVRVIRAPEETHEPMGSTFITGRTKTYRTNCPVGHCIAMFFVCLPVHIRRIQGVRVCCSRPPVQS